MLPRADKIIRSQYLDDYGLPLPGSEGDIRIQNTINRVKKVAIEDGYKRGIDFALEDITKYAKALVTFDLEAYEKLPEMSDYCGDLKKCFAGFYECIKGLSTQINNKNVTNYREGTRTIIGRIERIFGLKKGDILNNYISINEKKIVDGRTVANRTKRKKKEEVKEEVKEEPKEKLDPTDVLINKEV